MVYTQLRPLLTETDVSPSAPCWTLLDVLALCLRADPSSRATPAALLDHPFFDLSFEDSVAFEREAEAFVTSPPLVKDWVADNLVRPLQQLHSALDQCLTAQDPDHSYMAATEKGKTKTSTGADEGDDGDGDAARTDYKIGLMEEPNVDLSVISDLLHLMTEIIRDDDATTPGLVMGRRDPREARWLAAHRPGVVDEAMKQEVLEGLSTLARHPPDAQERGGAMPAGFLKGQRELPAGGRLIQRLEKLAQQLLLAIRGDEIGGDPEGVMGVDQLSVSRRGHGGSGGHLNRHVGSFLRMLVMLFTSSPSPPPLCHQVCVVCMLPLCVCACVPPLCNQVCVDHQSLDGSIANHHRLH